MSVQSTNNYNNNPNPDFTRDTAYNQEVLNQQNISNPALIRWNNNPGPVSGSTPFGIYDNDPVFQIEAPRAARYAAQKLGYPISDVELVDVNFYTCLEEAVSVYSSQVNQFNIRENMSLLQGLPTTTDVTQKNVQGIGLPLTITLSKAYSTEVGTGGNVDWKHDFFEVQPGVGVYDLQELIGSKIESGNRIEIKRVFHHELPASRIFAPYATTGLLGGGEGQPIDLLNELGGGASGGWQFFMTPVFEDLLRWQAVEFNQQMRRSLFSFELVNNKIRIMPIPSHRFKIWVDYIVEKDRASQVIWDSNFNVPPNASDKTPDTGSEDTGSCDDDFSDFWYPGSSCKKQIPAFSPGRVGRENPNNPDYDPYFAEHLSPKQVDNLITLDTGFDPSVTEELPYLSSGVDPYLQYGDPNWPGDAATPPIGWKPPQLRPKINKLPTPTPAPVAAPVIGDYSNVPYNFIQYQNINDVGKQWIRKYFLALCKEVLGSIRSKYATIPVPGGETTLDGAELRSEAVSEKTDLITELRENLLASGRSAQIEKQTEQAKQMQEQLMKVPLYIYVGGIFWGILPLYMLYDCMPYLL